MLVAAKTRFCERDWFFMNEVRSRSDGVSSHHAPACRWITAEIRKYLRAAFGMARHLGQFLGGQRVGHAMAGSHAGPSRRQARSGGSGSGGWMGGPAAAVCGRGWFRNAWHRPQHTEEPRPPRLHGASSPDEP